ETYFHVGVIVIFLALLSEVIRKESWLEMAAVLLFAAAAIFAGIKFGRFAFVLYGILFSYVGISAQLLQSLHMDSTVGLAYFVLSGSIVTISVMWLAPPFGR